MAVGLASTSQKAKQLLDKMNVEGRITEEEGKRIIDELFNSGKDSAAHIKEDIKLYITDILGELQTPTQKAFNELQERVAQLEAQLKNRQHEV